MKMVREVIGDYTTFLDDILARVEEKGINLADFSQLDHVCYRTTSLENYRAKKQQLQHVAQLLGETSVNGRPISTFRLDEPLHHDQWRIDAIELPAPKPGADHAEGLEHVEFVLYDDIPTFVAKYPGLPFEMRSAERGINPEVGLRLGELSVKFHLLSLATVVYLEHKLGITEVAD